MIDTRWFMVCVLIAVLIGCGGDDAAEPTPKSTPAQPNAAVTEGPSGSAQPVPRVGDATRYQSARVGDWIAVSVTGRAPAQIRRTVMATDAKFATVKEETTRDGETFVDETKYRLDKTYELPPAPGAKDEILGEGDETLRVGDRDYACHWVHGKRTWDMGGQARHSEYKVWRCIDVPFGGIVKSEISGMMGEDNATMTGCGRGR